MKWAATVRRQLHERGGTDQPRCACGQVIDRRMWDAHRRGCAAAREEVQRQAAPAGD